MRKGYSGVKYTEDFKQQIIDLYNSGKRVSELSSEYGVSTVSIHRWIKERNSTSNSISNGININSNNTNINKDDLLEKYKKLLERNREIELENEILKKATAIFARKQHKR
jgi:transposase